MGAPKREGPKFLTWLMGRFDFPPPAGRCAVCGAPGADAEIVKQLREAGMGRIAHFAGLCETCRKERRNELLHQSLK